MPAFAFPATAATHLSTPEGWKAELAWVADYVLRQFTCPKAVTNPTTKLTGLNVEQLRWTGQRVTATLNRHRHLG